MTTISGSFAIDPATRIKCSSSERFIYPPALLIVRIPANGADCLSRAPFSLGSVMSAAMCCHGCFSTSSHSSSHAGGASFQRARHLSTFWWAIPSNFGSRSIFPGEEYGGVLRVERDGSWVSDWWKRAGFGALMICLQENAELRTVETSTGNLPGWRPGGQIQRQSLNIPPRFDVYFDVDRRRKMKKTSYVQRSKAVVLADILSIMTGLCASSVATAAGQSSAPAPAPPSQFAICAVCHTTTTDSAHGMGPNLRGVVGRKAGTAPGFQYSQPMRNSRIRWTPQELDSFLADVRAKVPGTLMPFPGLPDAADRQAVIAYLKTLR